MADLTTLVNLKAWLSVTSSTDDVLLARLITSASNYIETYVSRVFEQQSYTERRDGNDNTYMVFANYPVTAVTSLTINGIDIAASPDNAVLSAGYGFDDGQIWLQGFAFSRGKGNVVMSYNAGYSETPAAIEQACIELCSLRYRERDRIGQVSKTIGGEVVTFSQKDMSDSIATILEQYKKRITI